MITAPVSLNPCFVLITVAVLCFAAWANIIPLPDWMQVLGLYLGVAAFAFACGSALDWITDRVTRYANIKDIVDPSARMMEAIAKMNHDQLEVVYTLFGFEPEQVAEGDYVKLEDGTAVSKQAIVEISKNAHGIDLRPEREYSANQPQIRYAHDALTQAGVVEPARGRRGPRIKDTELWEKVVEMAKAGRMK